MKDSVLRMEKFITFSEATGMLLVALSWIAAQLAPIFPFLAITLALVIADLVTGIWAASARGEKISSRGLRQTVKKVSVYFVAILLAAGMQEVFGIPLVTYLVALLIGTAEFKSNLENVEAITGTPLWRGIRHLFERVLKK